MGLNGSRYDFLSPAVKAVSCYPFSYSLVQTKGAQSHNFSVYIGYCGYQQRWTSGTLPSFPPLKVTNLLLHGLGWMLGDFKVALSSSQSRPLYSFILVVGNLKVGSAIFNSNSALGTAVDVMILTTLAFVYMCLVCVHYKPACRQGEKVACMSQPS